jgi:hypothetical protein
MTFAARFSQELALILVLYAIWQILGSLGTVREADGFTNGRRIYDVERALHLGNEGAIEAWFLPHPLWVQLCNGYYALIHVPALAVFLVWLFVRHREHYPRVRNTVALVTGVCLCIHFIPVAPPRLYPELGFVDTAKLYDQSVYGTIGHGLSDQMSAMPSIHVAWALIVGLAHGSERPQDLPDGVEHQDQRELLAEPGRKGHPAARGARCRESERGGEHCSHHRRLPRQPHRRSVSQSRPHRRGREWRSAVGITTTAGG